MQKVCARVCPKIFSSSVLRKLYVSMRDSISVFVIFNTGTCNVVATTTMSGIGHLGDGIALFFGQIKDTHVDWYAVQDLLWQNLGRLFSFILGIKKHEPRTFFSCAYELLVPPISIRTSPKFPTSQVNVACVWLYARHESVSSCRKLTVREHGEKIRILRCHAYDDSVIKLNTSINQKMQKVENRSQSCEQNEGLFDLMISDC